MALFDGGNLKVRLRHAGFQGSVRLGTKVSVNLAEFIEGLAEKYEMPKTAVIRVMLNTFKDIYESK